MELAKDLKSIIFISTVSAVALIQMAYQVSLPGPYYDEAAHGVYASWLLTGKQVLGGFWSPPFVYDVSIIGLHTSFPVLGSLGYYVGPLEGYLSLISMALFGVNIVSLRIIPMIFETAAIPFLFLFMRNRFGYSSAYATTLLFSVQPSLLLWSRVGLYPLSIIVFFMVSSLYFFDRWMRGRELPSLAIGFFLLGLGFETSIVFAWFIVGLAVTTLIMRIRLRIKLRVLVIMVTMFLMGVGPYLLPWISGENLHFFSQHATTSYAGVNNALYFDHLLLRIQHLAELIQGNVFAFYGGLHYNPIAFPLFVVSFVGSIVLVVFGRRISHRNEGLRARLFLQLVFLVMLAQTPITISSLNPLHLILLLPFTLMITGSLLGAVWDSSKAMPVKLLAFSNRRVLRGFKVIILLVLSVSVLLDISTTVSYQIDLARSGGVGFWSDAVTNAATYLVTANCSYVLAVDWGLSYGLLIASGGRLSFIDVFWVDGDAFRDAVSSYMQAPSNSQLCFVSWRNIGTSFNRLDLLRTIVASWHKTLMLEGTFYQRDGLPIIDVYRIL